MKIYEIGTGYTSIPAKVPAATESIVEELTKAFIANGRCVEIVDIADPNRTSTDLPITEVKVPSVFTRSDVSLGIVHKLKRVVYSICLSSKLKKILKKAEEKVVLHFHNQYNLFFFLKLTSKKIRSKAQIAYTCHNGMWSLPLEESEPILKKKYFQEIYSMPGADRVFVLNNEMKKNMMTKLGMTDESIVQIDNGVNTQQYIPLELSEINAIKDKFGLAGKKVIVQVGAVNENKGQGRSVELLAPILKRHADLVYAYVGDVVSEEYHQTVLETIKRLELTEQAVYLGSVSPGKEMNTIYNIAQAMIFSSKYEGFPLVCIEALSAGVPILLNTALSFDFGQGALRLGENAEDEIEKTLTDNISELKNAARENAKQNYTWEIISEKYIDALIG